MARKARRDIRRQRWQYFSVALTVFLGLALFAASFDAFLNLERSYRRTYDRLAFADLTVTGGASHRIAADLAGVDGVGDVATRRQAEIGIRIDGDHVLLGRIVEVPSSGDAGLNRLDLLDGSRPAPADHTSVLTERHMSDHFRIEPGDVIDVRAPTGWHAVSVAGSVVSPEYIWPARSRQDLLTSPDDFGVVFGSSGLLDLVAPRAVEQVLVRFEPGVDPEGLTDVLATIAFAGGASSVQPRADQPSNAALQEDVSGFGELSFMFPALFLSAAAMATYILLGRVVRSQQAAIATLRANGMSTARIVVHYLATGMSVTGVAGLVGLVVGVAAGRVVTGVYTDAISVPDTVTDFHAGTIVVGVVLALATGGIAAAAPAIVAGRTRPAAALGGIVPGARGGRSLAERVLPPLARLPAPWRMVLRGIGRDRRRSLTTAAGVVLALTLILASWGMVDTVNILLDRQFNEVQREDALIHIDSSESSSVAALADLAGVERAESVVTREVVVVAGDRRYATQAVAFDPDTEMHDFGATGLPTGGLVAGRSLGDVLRIDEGDAVTVATEDGRSLDLPVVGFVDEPLGTFVYLDTGTIVPLAADATVRSVMVSFSGGVDRAVMRREITSLPGVVAYVDSRSLYETAQDLLSLFYAFVGVMLVFGSVMAFALLFNTTTVNASVRSPELAALTVNGVSTGQLGRLLAAENLLLTVLSIFPGLAIGYGVAALFTDSFSSDLFDFGLQMRARSLFLSAAAVLAVSVLAQWPAARAIASLDVARVVRERSS